MGANVPIRSVQLAISSRLFWRVAVIQLTLFASGSTACGQELIASLSRDSYELYEPVVVNMTLRFDDPPGMNADLVQEPILVQRQLPHRVVAELRDSDGVLAIAILGGGGFSPAFESSSVFRATFYGCFGTKVFMRDHVEFVFFDNEGSYTLVVRDRDNGWASEGIPIAFNRPANQQAADMFRKDGVDTILLLLDLELGAKAMNAFQTLAHDFSDTTYGKWSRLVLAMRAGRGSYKPRGRAKPTNVIERELVDALSVFPKGHPLRCRALLELVQVQVALGSDAEARETTGQLLKESRDGALLHQGLDLRKSLAHAVEYRRKNKNRK